MKNFAVVPNSDQKPSMLVTGDDYGGVKVRDRMPLSLLQTELSCCSLGGDEEGRSLTTSPHCRSRCSTIRVWPTTRHSTDSTDIAVTSRAVGN